MKMLTINHSNCVHFLVSSLLVVPLIVQLAIISQSFSLIDCLSLTELHSTLSSNHNNNNQQFKSRLTQDKSVRDTIHNLNHRNHPKLTISNLNRDSILNKYYPQLITKNNYELTADDLDDNLNGQYFPGLPFINTNDDYVDNLPENYLIAKSPLTINGINKRQDEVVMDIPLEYTSDIPYEFYPELWPSNQQRSPSFKGKVNDDDLTSSSDILSQVLAVKIATLLEPEPGQSRNRVTRKRVLVKRNHRSGLSGNGPSNGGNHHQVRSLKVAPNLSSKLNHRTNNMKPKQLSVDSKHRPSSSSSSPSDGKDSKVTFRKLGDTKKVKLNRIPLKSTLGGHHQPVKGDFAKLVNGKAVHLSPMMVHSKIINSTGLGQKELNKSKKRSFISKNFRKLEANPRNRMLNFNRKDKSVTTNPLASPSSMKEFFNEIDLPKGSKNMVKRSLSSVSEVDLSDLGLRRDDETIDGYVSNINVEGDDEGDAEGDDDSVDGGNNNGQGEDDLRSEVNEGEYRSTIKQLPSSSSVFQSNPWLVDEATRTLMRSLTVKRRKRGNNEDDQLTLTGLGDDDDDDDDQLSTSTSTPTTTTTTTPTRVKDNDEIDEPTTKSTTRLVNQMLTKIIELDDDSDTDIDEIPARIVKKDGASLTEGHLSNEDANDDDDDDDKLNNKPDKRSDSGLMITNGSQLKSMVSIASLLSGLNSGGNETIEEDNFTHGLITIDDDLDKLNKSVPINLLINDDDGDDNDKDTSKVGNPIGLASSTKSPITLTVGYLDKSNDLIVNGSIDVDDSLTIETINSNNEKRFTVNNKRKRSLSGNRYFDEVGQQESPLPLALLIAQEEAKFIDVDDKLERIEETLILEALDLIKKGNHNGHPIGQLLPKGNSNIQDRIESRLNAAYDLEDMRLALTDLHKIMQKMSTEDDDEDEDDQPDDDETDGEPMMTIDGHQVDINNDHGNEINDETNGQEVYLDSIDKLSISGKLNSDSDDQRDVKGDTGQRNSYNGHWKISPTNNYPHHVNQIKLIGKSDECPAVRALTTDCSAVKDVVPYGPLKIIFRKACNWHEVCYLCGELFGLLSSDCDLGFLEESRLSCNDSASCETASRLILMPLKSRRTFYKQKVSPLCYQQSCIESFLLQSKRKR